MNDAPLEDWREYLSRIIQEKKENYLIELTCNEDKLNGEVICREIGGVPLQFFIRETGNSYGNKFVTLGLGCVAGKQVHKFELKMGVVLSLFNPLKGEFEPMIVRYHDITSDVTSLFKGVRISIAKFRSYIDAHGLIRATARLYVHSAKGLSVCNTKSRFSPIEFFLIITSVVHRMNQYDFTTPSDDSDVTFIVGSTKLYANRAYLSMVSPYFKAMFSGNFDEGAKQEITLRDTNHEEFKALLYSVYPSFTAPNDDTVEILLRLSDMYQIHFVMKTCEEYLLKCITKSDALLLLLADRYRLIGLQAKICSSLTTAVAIKRLMESRESEEYSVELKLALFKLMVEKTVG